MQRKSYVKIGKFTILIDLLLYLLVFIDFCFLKLLLQELEGIILLCFIYVIPFALCNLLIKSNREYKMKNVSKLFIGVSIALIALNIFIIYAILTSSNGEIGALYPLFLIFVIALSIAPIIVLINMNAKKELTKKLTNMIMLIISLAILCLVITDLSFGYKSTNQTNDPIYYNDLFAQNEDIYNKAAEHIIDTKLYQPAFLNGVTDTSDTYDLTILKGELVHVVEIVGNGYMHTEPVNDPFLQESFLELQTKCVVNTIRIEKNNIEFISNAWPKSFSFIYTSVPINKNQLGNTGEIINENWYLFKN